MVRSPAPRVEFDLVTTTNDLEHLEPAWQALWDRVPTATPFQSPAWLLPWWHQFGTADLLTVAAWRDGRLAALLPLYVYDDGDCRKLLPLGVGISDYLDALAEPGAENLLGPMLAVFGETAGRWDRLDFPELPENAAFAAAALPPGWVEAMHPHEACPMLDLPTPGAPLADAVPRVTLRNGRRALNKARARGTVEIAAAEPDTLAAMLDETLRLHAARWNAAGEPGVVADPAVRAFHAEAAPLLLARGLLRLYVLRLGGVAIGAYLGLLAKGAAYAYLGGYDPAFVEESPGTILMGHAIETARAEGARHFHFLRGREAYKYAWGAVDRWTRCRSLHIHAASA